MTHTCTDFCAGPAPCVLNWFKSPCICMVSAGGVSPTVGERAAEQQTAASRETRHRAEHNR